MTDKKTEALKLALERLDTALCCDEDREDGYYEGAIIAIREALAEQPAQQQEPVAWHHPECEGECIACLIEGVVQASYGSQGLAYLQRHLASTSTSKPWAGLTDEERGQVYASWRFNGSNSNNLELCRAIEAKLKEKNT